MGINQRYRVVDTHNGKVYRENVEDDDILFFIDPSGHIHRRIVKKDVVIMEPVEGFNIVKSLGIFDMHDIEIFEGDILCEKYKEKDGTINPYYYVVKFNEETLQFGGIDYANDFLPFNGDTGISTEDVSTWYEVVGNVWEDDLEYFWKIDREWHANE